MTLCYEIEKIKFPTKIRGPEQEAEYLMQDGNMKNRYLDQCLDSCRWGSIMTVLYEMNTFQMVDFIKSWMEQNKDNLKFHCKGSSSSFDLPRIHYDIYPRNSDHKGRTLDFEGRIKCADEDKKDLREALIEEWTSYDELSQSKRKEYMESHLDDDELEEYENAPRITVKERCGAIISDKLAILPLAEIIERLNVFGGSRTYCKDLCKDPLLGEFDTQGRCFGHIVQDHLEFPFSGWTLASYVQKWHEQLPKGSAPFTTPELTKKLMKKIKTF